MNFVEVLHGFIQQSKEHLDVYDALKNTNSKTQITVCSAWRRYQQLASQIFSENNPCIQAINSRPTERRVKVQYSRLTATRETLRPTDIQVYELFNISPDNVNVSMSNIGPDFVPHFQWAIHDYGVISAVLVVVVFVRGLHGSAASRGCHGTVAYSLQLPK